MKSTSYILLISLFIFLFVPVQVFAQDSPLKACEEISAKDCPTDRCELLKACDGKKICYNKISDEVLSCGGMGYRGQKVACCEGLSLRCGVEYFDGTCDNWGRNSIYAIPVCIPCGNDVCEQFENACNCPEDCL